MCLILSLSSLAFIFLLFGVEMISQGMRAVEESVHVIQTCCHRLVVKWCSWEAGM